MFQKKRLDYVDIAKGIAIVAVVFGHIASNFSSPSFLPTQLLLGGLWHVPVFFLISGFFLKDEKLIHPLSFTLSKIKTLHFWTLCFCIPAVLLHNFFLHCGFYSTDIIYGGKIMTEYNWGTLCYKVIQTILFAGREPITGAMWFAYVLSLSLITYSLITYFSHHLLCKINYEIGRAFICVLLAVLSTIASNQYHLTLNRFSNTIVVTLLLCIGQYLFQKKKVEFTSWTICIIAALMAWQSAILCGGISLNNNCYRDLSHLVISATSMLYVVVFISKKIENTFIGKIFRLAGEKSFYIMAMHFLAFKIASLLLIGSVKGLSQNSLFQSQI